MLRVAITQRRRRRGGNPPTVNTNPVATVEVTLDAATIEADEGTVARAVLRDAEGKVLSGRTIEWSSSDELVATVASNGVVTPVGVGTATITATSEGQSDGALLTVEEAVAEVATVEVTLDDAQVVEGTPVQATAVVRDASANVLEGRTVTWESSDTDVATVDAAGVVTTVGPGSATITGTCEGISDGAALEVLAAVALVEVSLADAEIDEGATSQATAVVKDAQGVVLAGRTVVWASTNESVATVDGSGLALGVTEGTATIQATCEGVTGSADLDVVDNVVATVELTPTTLSLSAPEEPALGDTEPAYDPDVHALIDDEDFNSFSGVTGTNSVKSKYPTGRTLDAANAHVSFDTFASLVTGRNGVGQALRLVYGGPDGASDIVVGPEGRLDSIGELDAGRGLPEKAGPYTHFYWSSWVRFSAGADPAASNTWGVKGFMFWHTGAGVQGGRYESAVNRGDGGAPTRGPKGCNPSNATSGMDLYKNAIGRAPEFSEIADGQWHRVTYEIYCGSDPAGVQGWRIWIDGELIYDDVGIEVGLATPAGHYAYDYPITDWRVFGNYITAEVAAASPEFTMDLDNWIAWTDQ